MGTLGIAAVILFSAALMRCECLAAETETEAIIRQGMEALEGDNFDLAISRFADAMRRAR